MGKPFSTISKASNRTSIAKYCLIFLGLLAASVISSATANSDAMPSKPLEYTLYDDPTLLSIGEIKAITEDQQGYIWVAGNQGLVRYDGYTFKAYLHDDNDTTSISTNSINDILISDDGYLWVATYWELNRFDPATGLFTHFGHNPDDPRSLSHNSVMSLAQGANGVIWVGTIGGGLNRYNPQTQDFDHFTHQAGNKDSLSANNINALFEDSKGRLWVGVDGKGVDLFNPKSGKVQRRFSHKPKGESTLTHNTIGSISEGTDGTIWITTIGDGYNRINPKTGEIALFPLTEPQEAGPHPHLSATNIYTTLREDNGDILFGTGGSTPLSVYRPASDDFVLYQLANSPAVFITSLFRDRSGGLWLGLIPRGLLRINRYAEAFNSYQKNHDKINGLNNSSVLSVGEDQQGNLLVGTRKGLNRINRKSGEIDLYQRNTDLDLADPTSLSANTISAILHDVGNEILLGNTWRGMDRLDLASGKIIRRYSYNNDDKNSIGNGEVWSIFKDHEGVVWAGGNNGMLHRYRRESDDFTRMQLVAPHKQTPGRIVQIYEDVNHDLWFASDDGLFYAKRLSEVTQTDDIGLKVEYYGDAPAGQTPFNLDRRAVRAITEDKQGNMWIGTEGGGVHVWNRANNNYKIYLRADGLPHDGVFGIIQDEQGNIWLSTGNGIASVDLQTKEFTHYNKDHGLKGTNFNQAVYYKTRHGELAFGNDDGIILITPNKIYRNTYTGSTVISDFLVFNKSTPQGMPLSHVQNITLDYTQSMFAFRMAALNYDLPSRSQYAYKLEGFDKDWNYVGTQRSATYTNIDPGNYIFKVKSANNEGIWNDNPRVVHLTILPPWWRSWWAWTLYSMVVLALLGLVFYSFLQKKRAQDKEQLNQKLLDLDRVKDTFLANTSHELRTPLNGIIGLSQALIDGVGGQQNHTGMENLKLIVGSGKRLSYLINDILDYSKLKDNAITLNRSAVDLHNLVEGIIHLSQPMLEGKALTLNNDIDKFMPSLIVDENRLQQILHNIIGNAIKFTQKGRIKISTKTTNNAVWIYVRDTGVGIAPENISKVFEAFQQEDGSQTRTAGGTGLGLAVTKQLVELHGGEISINSILDQGTSVRFSLSKSDKVVTSTDPEFKIDDKKTYEQNDDEKQEQPYTDLKNHEAGNENPPLPEITTLIPTPSIPTPSSNSGEYHILIVDDEPVNRRVLLNLLPLKYYRVTPCPSGYHALELLEKTDHDFDLILLDVMMPGISGYEVCSKLRERYSMSELPIIFLTAKSQVSDLEDAYNVGGNDYLTKPVAKEELFARIETHLALLKRNRYIEKKVILRTKEVTQQKQEITRAYEKLKQTQGQLVQSEKMSSLGTLVAGVGHEINNPINFMNSAAHLINKDLTEFQALLQDLAGDDSDDVMPMLNERFNILSEHLSTLSDGSERITKIVNNLRTFSRGATSGQDADSTEALQLSRLASGLKSTLALVKTNYKTDIEFNCEIQDDPALPCNSPELNQVFMNLMVNACQAMRDREAASLSITMQQIASELCITVKDTGCGMTQDTMNKIFDPFFTTKPEGEGTGLGMSISYGIIERHKGRIEVSSEVEKGTEIKIYVPLTNNNP